jgi:hypothetical protein
VRDARGTDLRRAERERRAGPTTAPFVTVAPESIAVRGYVTRDSAGHVFHAPDADVLLAPDFLRTHCVSDARAEGGLDAVGIRTATSVPGTGVRGTLLLDPTTSELRRFEFRYERLPPALRGREAGGWVTYRRLDGGRWIADAWTIRFPLPSETPGGIVGRGVTVDRVQEGRVLRVYAAGATDAVRSRGALVTGVVLDSLGTGGPLAGAAVRVPGTARTAVTDARGRFRLDSVPAGRRARGARPAGARLARPRRRPRWIDVQDGDSLAVRLATPSPGGCARRRAAPTPRAPRRRGRPPPRHGARRAHRRAARRRHGARRVDHGRRRALGGRGAQRVARGAHRRAGRLRAVRPPRARRGPRRAVGARRGRGGHRPGLAAAHEVRPPYVLHL